MGDIQEMVTDPRRFAYNRFSPYMKLALTLGTGRDYRGVKLDNVGQLKDALSWLIPISVGGTESATPMQRVLGASGVSNKPGPTAVTDMYDQARSFKEKLARTDPRTRAEVARANAEVYQQSDYRPFIKAVQDQDKEKATGELVTLMREKGKPLAAMTKYFSNLDKAPFSGSHSLEPQFYNGLSNGQKYRYRQSIQERQQLGAQFKALLPYAFGNLTTPERKLVLPGYVPKAQ